MTCRDRRFGPFSRDADDNRQTALISVTTSKTENVVYAAKSLHRRLHFNLIV